MRIILLNLTSVRFCLTRFYEIYDTISFNKLNEIEVSPDQANLVYQIITISLYKIAISLKKTSKITG